MKNYIKLAVFLLFIIPIYSQNLTERSVPSPFSSISDPYESVYNLAMDLKDSNLKDQAVIEFKRYIFLQDFAQGTHLLQAFYELYDYYQEQKQYETAEIYLEKAIITSRNQINSQFSQDELILHHIELLKNHANTEKNTLLQNRYILLYQNDSYYPENIQKTASLAILENLLTINDWDSFSNLLTTIEQNNAPPLTQEEFSQIHQLLQYKTNLKLKNPKTAAGLSLLPGLGQLYAGDPADALNAFLLNGSLLAVSTFSLISMDFWTFSLLELPTTLHFYRGNLYNAQKETVQANNNKINTIKSQIQTILQSAKNRTAGI